MSEASPASALPDSIRSAMAAAGITSQSDLAAAIDIDPTKLSKSLRGKRRFTSIELARIAAACSTTVDHLTGATELAEQPDAPSGTRKLLSSSNVAARLGISVSAVTLKASDPDDRFPGPTALVGGRFQGWSEESIDRYLAGETDEYSVDTELAGELSARLFESVDVMYAALPKIGFPRARTRTEVDMVVRAAAELQGEALHAAFTGGDLEAYQHLRATDNARLHTLTGHSRAARECGSSSDVRAWAIAQAAVLAAEFNEIASKIPIALEDAPHCRPLQEGLQDLATDLYRHLATPAAAAAAAPH